MASIFAIEKSNNIENNDYSENDNLSFADRILKKPKISSITNYCNVEFIPPTSSIVEILFSRAKLICSDLRNSLTRYHLECALFCQLNKPIWSIQDIAIIYIKK